MRDSIAALALAVLLGVAWMVRDHLPLSALRLPDTDDGMRLQQVRDWLDGQAFADLAQHRLGPPPGVEMHWSRGADLLPAALILLLTPLLGSHMALVGAVAVVPFVWFALVLLLVAAIARRLEIDGTVAAVIAALAFPATTLFFPGRIDHHALQMVLVLALLWATLGQGSLRNGAVAGLTTMLSLVIVLETAPLLAVGGLAIALRWWCGDVGAQARITGYATALLLALAAGRTLLATSGWAYPACDGFTAILWRAAMLVALAPAVMAVAGFATTSRKRRFDVMMTAGGLAVGCAALASPACLHPYGAVDPVLARVWLAQVAEAQSVLSAPPWHSTAYCGLALVGLAAGLWHAVRRRTTDAAILAGFQTVAVLVALTQLRGAYAAALLAAPALAAMIAAARARGALPLAAAWLASAGMVYAFLGDALTPKAAAAPGPDCTSPAALARVAALPTGLVAAPVDLSGFLLPATRHRFLAGPYHRNTQGNRAMLDLFLRPSAEAEATARRWGVDYVALCPDGLGELGSAGNDTHRLAGALRAGQVPGWLAQVSRPGEAPMIYRLVGHGTTH
ncbi:hypothetical protein [Sphingomonas elodea]|uniref:hypothetical protein n=1 Tax=Sphingomonas elodea TaxID=179878 RepID=UPI0002630835|nr:hypothetical protein [Sphingomonas elodea]